MKSLSTLFVAAVIFFYAVENANSTPDEWRFCANENETCRFSGKRIVKYGVGNAWFRSEATDAISCNNNSFGDPAPFILKRCYYRVSRHCANEGEKCIFRGTKNVRYGTHGKYVFKRFTGGVFCTNPYFGDPLPFVRKECHVDE